MSFEFPRWERLKKQKLIQQLFAQRQSLGAYPLRLFWSELPKETETDKDFLLQAAFSVPKKKFKRANKRNRIKRQMREIYRLHRQELLQTVKDKQKKLVCLWFYAGEELPEWDVLKSKLLYLLDKLTKQL